MYSFGPRSVSSPDVALDPAGALTYVSGVFYGATALSHTSAGYGTVYGITLGRTSGSQLFLYPFGPVTKPDGALPNANVIYVGGATLRNDHRKRFAHPWDRVFPNDLVYFAEAPPQKVNVIAKYGDRGLRAVPIRVLLI